jgi:glycerophosphoryl diester phosphodiesterase
VVTHDTALNPELTRGPDGAWLSSRGPPVRALTLAALRQYDVGRLRPGSAYASLFPKQTPCDGARIPTLAEVFALTVPASVRVAAEVKVRPGQPDLAIPTADAVIAAAAAASTSGLLSIRSFDWRPLRHVRRRHPELPLTWLTGTEAFAASGAPAAIAAEARVGTPVRWTPVWAPEHTRLTQALLAEAHALGLAVVPWTVNAPAEMARLIAWGVDGLCSDRPDLARAAMAAAGLPLPRRITMA